MKRILFLISFSIVYLMSYAQAYLSGQTFVDFGERFTYEIKGMEKYTINNAYAVNCPFSSIFTPPNILALHPTTLEAGMKEIRIRIFSNAGNGELNTFVVLGPYDWSQHIHGPERIFQGEIGIFSVSALGHRFTLTNFSTSPKGVLELVGGSTVDLQAHFKASSTYTGKVTITIYYTLEGKSRTASKDVWIDPAP